MLELHPETAASDCFESDEVLPRAARAFGKVIDPHGLRCGDLLLTRPLNPEWVSKKIIDAQQGAFSQEHAQWTHAAVCLGDGENLCEANFGIPGRRNGVMVRSIQVYADGEHIVRARRPRGLTDQQRLRIVIGALTNLTKSYSFLHLIRLSLRGWKGIDLGDATQGGIRAPKNAIVCSTLYADAVMYGANIAISRASNLTVPALLSSSKHFEDVDLRWLSLKKESTKSPAAAP